jgi:hypothetical protein
LPRNESPATDTVNTNEIVAVRIDKCANAAEYFALVGGPALRSRWALEHYLASLHQPAEPFGVAGVCVLCDRAVTFAVEFVSPWTAPDGIVVPNWRESMVCPVCGMNARHRMVASLMREACRKAPPVGVMTSGGSSVTVYITEQRTPLFRWCVKEIGSRTLTIIGSEYRDADVELSDMEPEPRHEDAERLTLADESVDVYVSCDVFEHLSDPYSALREMRRVLRPGGRAILTFPMDPHLPSTVRRARRNGTTVEYLLPAVYHLDPARPGGALVFNDFGWDILEEIRKAGLRDVGLYVYWSYLFGYLGIQFFFVADRAPAAQRWLLGN